VQRPDDTSHHPVAGDGDSLAGVPASRDAATLAVAVRRHIFMDWRIGVVPLPIYLLLFALVAALVVLGDHFTEINTAIAVLVVGGFACGELGNRLPYLRQIGAAAICATFVPSFLVHEKWLPDAVVNGVAEFTKSSNFLYLFVAAIVVGSILSMDRAMLIKGVAKIFVPLACGSIAAMIVGTLVGTALGLGAFHTFCFIVVPIMAGGVGEGAIPLSIGYAGIMHRPQGELFAEVLPSVMLGSLAAILLAGMLDRLGRFYPHLSGEGRLQPDGEHEYLPNHEVAVSVSDVGQLAAAGITAIALYLVGLVAFDVFGFPAPVTMLFAAVLLKLARAFPPELEHGAFVVYKFFAAAVTYPLLFAVGVAMTPWEKLAAAFTPSTIATVVATVAALVGTGFAVAWRLRMYPIDTAIVTACHSGQGGTGDVAILSASNRLVLMPFAQVATRIGGAITVMLTLLVLARFV